MLSKNLKYYRLKKNYSKRELASLCQITPMAITHYENGERRPTMDILKALAKALDVRVTDFLAVRNNNLEFQHAEFRKNRSLTVAQQEYVREAVEEYFERFYAAVDILGGEVLPEPPMCHMLEISDDVEENAKRMRFHLGFSLSGPIGNLIESLENIGILVFECEIDNDKFSGMNGFVNGRPYVVVNAAMTDERNRSTIAHELAHLMFSWPDECSDEDEKRVEGLATSIAGAFLLPAKDAVRELGIRRKSITRDMLMVCEEYGISMLLLVKRAEIVGIISKTIAKDFYIKASQAGWKKNEPSRVKTPEEPMLFKQLVYRAVSEEEISIQKGAELLRIPFNIVEEQCCIKEV